MPIGYSWVLKKLASAVSAPCGLRFEPRSLSGSTLYLELQELSGSLVVSGLYGFAASPYCSGWACCRSHFASVALPSQLAIYCIAPTAMIP